jgi:hypothetical protein
MGAAHDSDRFIPNHGQFHATHTHTVYGRLLNREGRKHYANVANHEQKTFKIRNAESSSHGGVEACAHVPLDKP